MRLKKMVELNLIVPEVSEIEEAIDCLDPDVYQYVRGIRSHEDHFSKHCCQKVITESLVKFFTLIEKKEGRKYFCPIEYNIPENRHKLYLSSLLKENGFEKTKDNITYNGRIIATCEGDNIKFHLKELSHTIKEIMTIEARERDLLQVIKKTDEQLIDHANTFILKVIRKQHQSSRSKKENTDEAVMKIIDVIREEYNWNSLTLEELNTIKQRIDDYCEHFDPGIKAEGMNTVQWLTALKDEVENQISVKNQIKDENQKALEILPQCISVSDKYLERLYKDKDSIHASPTYRNLTQKKIDLITKAVRHLNDRKLEPRDKIKQFENTLRENASILKQHRHSKNWFREGLKQTSSLFLINLYRLLMGTKSNNLLSITDTRSHVERIKERLHRFKAKITPYITPKSDPLKP